MITYGLGTITYHSKDEQDLLEIPAADVNITIGLSKEEYDKLLISTSKIGDIYRYADMFSITRWNYEDLVNTIRTYLQAFIQKDANFLTARDISLDINKDLLNVLTSFRFYLDYMDKHLGSDFGKTSELASKFGNYCSNEYDNNLSYRLVYHLRNYAQHKGFVVNSINFGKFLDKENQAQVKHYLKTNISRNDLLEDKSFKKELKAEIENFPEEIDLMEHISKWMNSLARIHNQITHEIVPTALEDAKVIQNYLSRLTYDPDDERVVPAIFATDHPDEDIKKVKSIGHMPIRVKDAKQIIEYVLSGKSDDEKI